MYKKTYKAIMRRLLLTLALACPLLAMAQTTDTWMLVHPESETKIEMSTVAFLLASDNDDTFSVVCNNGTIVGGLSSICFAKEPATDISAPKGSGQTPMLSGDVNSKLTVSGLAPGTEISVYAADGRPAMAAKANNGGATLSVAHLAPGVYMLKAGSAEVKFTKR